MSGTRTNQASPKDFEILPPLIAAFVPNDDPLSIKAFDKRESACSTERGFNGSRS